MDVTRHLDNASPRASFPSPKVIEDLKRQAKRIRRNVLRMASGKGDGYVGQGLGAADIFAVLYFYEMHFNPQELNSPQRDRFLLSAGHYSIVLFATLVAAGVYPEDELATYGANGSRFAMSACETSPGVEITGGSLGHGLSQAVGMAIGSRLSGRGFRVFNFLSDGELQEGATWEAAMFAGHYKLDNLLAVVDLNNVQGDGHVADVMSVEPLVDKWRAFGWHAQAVDGNSVSGLVKALGGASLAKGQPKVLVCHTLMGKGVPFIETRPKTHFVRVEPHEWDLALRQLEESP